MKLNNTDTNKERLRTILFLLAVMGFVALVNGRIESHAPSLFLLAGILIFAYGIFRYRTTLRDTSSAIDGVEQEIKRIRKQRFIQHLMLFIPVNGAIVLWGSTEISNIRPESNRVYGFFLLLIAFMWLVILINHARSTFPSQRRLANREINFGKSLRLELTNLKPEKAKNKEKLKRGKYYQVGDDGELEEVEDEVMGLEEKPKRGMSGDG